MELSNQSLLENDVLHSLSRKRLKEVNQKANAFQENNESKLSLESEDMYSSITDTVKNLAEEQKDLFPEKETELEEVKTSNEEKEEIAEKKEPTTPLPKSNNQVYYYVGAIVVILGVIYVYQKTNGFKTFNLK